MEFDVRGEIPEDGDVDEEVIDPRFMLIAAEAGCDSRRACTALRGGLPELPSASVNAKVAIRGADVVIIRLTRRPRKGCEMYLPEVEEVKMGNPPIVQALCQVRFPVEPQLEEEKNIRKFRDAIRPAYPGFTVETVHQAVLGPDQSVHQGEPSKNWNFYSVDNSWRIVLSSSFLTLETTSYTRKAELLERFQAALSFLLSHIGPARRDRLGVRYLNALRAGGSVPGLLELVNPALHGIAGTGVAEDNELLSMTTDTRLLIDGGEGQLSIKAGLLPPNAALDIHPGFDERVFGLDFDLFDVRPKELNPAEIVENVEYFHSWIYRAFRWCLSDTGFTQCDPASGE